MTRIKIVLVFVFICILGVKGQMSNTMYFMERIPQSTMLNPATQPKCNVYVGFPAISSFQFSFGNNSLSISSILQKGKNDTLITFLNKDADKDIFFNDLKDKNSAFIDLQWQILAFGFRVKSWYFNLGVSIKGDASISYPKDFAKLAIKGIGIGDKFDLKYFGLDSRLYNEFAIGASKILNEDFTVGATVKLLNGVYDISTNNKAFNIESVEDEKGIVHINVDADMQLNTYLPMMENMPDTGDIKFGDIFKLKDHPEKSIKLFESYGFAFDLGASYSGFDKFILSASLIDLGYINWNKNANNINLKLKSYSFSGLDMNIDSLSIDVKGIQDSITNAFKVTKTSESYTTGLPTKLYLAGEYMPVKWFGVGALSITRYYQQLFYQQFMFSANLRPWNMLMFSFSYSVFDNGFSNLGFGTSLRLGPTQFYLVSDNIPFRYSSGFPLPYKAQNFSLRLGFNWVFGCSNKSKEKDKPLNYE